MISPYGFGASGMVRLPRLTVLGHAMIRGLADGAGPRLAAASGLSFTNAAVTLENACAGRSDRMPADHRVSVSVTLQF